MGVDYYIVERILNHKMTQLDQTYIHTSTSMIIRRELEKWHNEILDCVGLISRNVRCNLLFGGNIHNLKVFKERSGASRVLSNHKSAIVLSGHTVRDKFRLFNEF
jgi:hypothetical protein